jgi:predicted negative regulator of RcsB-dependent stress response
MAKQDRYTASRRTVMDTNEVVVNSAEEAYVPSADEQLEKVKTFYDGRKKFINYGLIAVAVALLGWVGYKYYQSNQEKDASNALARANSYMLADSTTLMLKGSGKFLGAEAVAKKYGGTKSGNVAAYMAGVGNLKLGNFKEAIKYLETFKSTNSLIDAVAFGSLGDAYWENNQLDKAVGAYEKASADKDNFQFSPIYLQRLGLIYEKQNKNDKALECYKRIKTDFPQSSVSRDIDKYLAKLGYTED